MKVVLFCGGLGTRIRDYSENIPKPMVPVGHQPILWHVMQYYSHYGHQDFVLCLGYKANVIKEFFLNYRPTSLHRLASSPSGRARSRSWASRSADWRVTLVDTGIWRNIGQRLLAVREHVKDEEMFLANYSDGLTDAPLPEMIDLQEERQDRLLPRRPPAAHLPSRRVRRATARCSAFRTSHDSDIWINGGYFIFRNEIFDYIARAKSWWSSRSSG